MSAETKIAWYFRAKGRNPEKVILWRAKARAKKFGITFDISIEDIVIPTHCPVLLIPLSFEGSRSSSPSLDRIVNSLGYIQGNVRVISNRANRLKSNLTYEEVERLLKYMGNEYSVDK